eukprot:scaffold42611_cov64-Phaeocystis_antarctica.AAC.3
MQQSSMCATKRPEWFRVEVKCSDSVAAVVARPSGVALCAASIKKAHLPTSLVPTSCRSRDPREKSPKSHSSPEARACREPCGRPCWELCWELPARWRSAEGVVVVVVVGRHGRSEASSCAGECAGDAAFPPSRLPAAFHATPPSSRPPAAYEPASSLLPATYRAPSCRAAAAAAAAGVQGGSGSASASPGADAKASRRSTRPLRYQRKHSSSVCGKPEPEPEARACRG